MDTLSICKINEVRQTVILSNYVRAISSTVTSALPTLSVLSIPMSLENRWLRRLGLLHYKRRSQQCLSLTVVVCVNFIPY